MIKIRCAKCKQDIRMDKGERMRVREGIKYHLACYLKVVVGK